MPAGGLRLRLLISVDGVGRCPGFLDPCPRGTCRPPPARSGLGAARRGRLDSEGLGSLTLAEDGWWWMWQPVSGPCIAATDEAEGSNRAIETDVQRGDGRSLHTVDAGADVGLPHRGGVPCATAECSGRDLEMRRSVLC